MGNSEASAVTIRSALFPITHSLFTENRVFLVQTDTTVGFLSQNAAALEQVKGRPEGKQFLKVFADLRTYKASGGRVPPKYRTAVRRAKKTTFIARNRAFRIVSDTEHHRFLQRYGWMYSTSANPSGCAYKRSFCEAEADIIVEDPGGLHEAPPSSIVRLGRTKRRSVR
jgi:tRNA A37 threonylcarbamoyladenosine synthetase subunit TsaC/SUA5/YrdC